MPYIKFTDFPEKKYKCPIRLIRICKENGINNLEDFSKMTVNELLSLPECGTRTMILVRGFLRDNDLDFRESLKGKQNHLYRLPNKPAPESVSNGERYQNISEKIA